MTSMIAQCPSCSTEFELDPNKVPITGLRARCSVCSAVIVVAAASVALRREQLSGTASGGAYQTVHHGSRETMSVERPGSHQRADDTSTSVHAEPVRQDVGSSGYTNTHTRAHTSAGIPTSTGADVSESRSANPSAPTGTDGNGGVHHIDARSHVIAADPSEFRDVVAPIDRTELASSRDSIVATNSGLASFETPSTPAAPAVASTGVSIESTTASVDASAAASDADATRPIEAPRRKPVNPFLTRDPALRAKRLARALVSDIVAYHPAKHAEGLRDGTLKTLFLDEIRKSYEEYVDQVGREFAETTTHFRDALNDVLAGGRTQF